MAMSGILRPPIVTERCIMSWRIFASCDRCGKVCEPVHMPQRLHGFYCAEHCPVCGDGAARRLPGLRGAVRARD